VEGRAKGNHYFVQLAFALRSLKKFAALRLQGRRAPHIEA